MKMKKIYLVIIISVFSIVFFSTSYEKPTEYFSRFHMYLSPDGIDTNTNFTLNYSTQKKSIDYSGDPTFTLNVDFKYVLDSDSKYDYYINYANLEIKFEKFKLNLSKDTFKFYPEFLIDYLYIYYKDLGKQWLLDVDLRKNINTEFKFENIINNDEFGVGYLNKSSKADYEIKFSYENKAKDYSGKFSNTANQNKYDIFKSGYSVSNELTGSISEINNFYYTRVDNIPSGKVSVQETFLNFEAKINIKQEFLRGLRILSEISYGLIPVVNYDNVDLNADYLKETIIYDSDSEEITITYSNGVDKAIYQLPNSEYEIEPRLYYVNDIYFRRANILKPGNILTPHFNLYLRDINFGVVTLGYDHYMKKRYDFKGISSKEAKSINGGLDWVYTKNPITIMIMNELHLKFDEELKYATYLNLNSKYRTTGNNNYSIDLKTFLEKDLFNITINPEIKLRKDIFRLDLYAFFDYESKNEFEFLFDNIVSNYEIEAYVTKADIKTGLRIYNSIYRKFGEGYFREFNKKSDNWNWYLFFEFRRYFR